MGIIEKYRKEAQEKKAYNQIVAQRNKTAARQAYATESEKQARLAAQRKAVAKYNQPKKQGLGGMIGGFIKSRIAPSRPTRVSGGTRKVVSYVKKGKGYKKITRTVRTKARPMQPMQSQQPQLPWAPGGISSGSSNGNVNTKDVFGW